MINKYNYFDHSKGQFTLLPSAATEMFAKAYTIEKCGNNTITTQDYVNTNIGLFEPNFISSSGKSISIYWVSEDGKMLIRLSDHWSSVPIELKENLKVFKNIRFCRWKLVGNEKTILDNQGRNLVAGIIKFDDMKNIKPFRVYK